MGKGLGGQVLVELQALRGQLQDPEAREPEQAVRPREQGEGAVPAGLVIWFSKDPRRSVVPPARRYAHSCPFRPNHLGALSAHIGASPLGWDLLEVSGPLGCHGCTAPG